MRVAFVHNLKRGGARRTMAEHMQRLDAELLEVCLATATPVREDAHVIGLRPAAPRLPQLLRPLARYSDLGALLLAWRRAGHQLLELAPDVVVAHPCQFLQAPPAIMAAPERTVYFCHEFRRVDHEAAAAANRRRVTRLPYAAMYATERRSDLRAVAAAARVLTNSRYTADGIRRAYGREAQVLALGVPPDFVPAGEAAPPGHVLSVGSLIPSKGHDLVIAAVARCRRTWPVVIVAPGEEPREQTRLRRLAGRHGVSLRFELGIEDLQLRDLYRTAVATLYVAVAEPFGLVSLEAQACGCPVIVSDEGGLPETVLDGTSGWAVPRAPAAVAECLDRLESPELQARVSAAAAQHGARYTWEESTRQLAEVLASLRPRRDERAS